MKNHLQKLLIDYEKWQLWPKKFTNQIFQRLCILFDFYSRAKSPVELSQINSLAEFPIPENIEAMIAKKSGGETSDGPIAPPRRFKKEVFEKLNLFSKTKNKYF